LLLLFVPAMASPVRAAAVSAAESDEYRVFPVTISVRGPLCLRFPGTEYGEVSVPSIGADVLVLGCASGSEAVLGIPRTFVRDPAVDPDTGVVRFTVSGVRSFSDSEVVMQVHGERELYRKLMWLVTGKSMDDSPACDLVSRAATALHAASVLKEVDCRSHERAAARRRNEQRARRRLDLDRKWELDVAQERETIATRERILTPPRDAPARANYADMLHQLLLQGVSKTPPKV